MGTHPIFESDFDCLTEMVGAVGTAHSCSNPNTIVWNSKGIWLTYVLLILLLHIILLCVPWLTIEQVWTTTNLAHSVLLYFFMHLVKGTPFHTADQGMSRFLTAWEQMDGEIQYTKARKFFFAVPVGLYLLTSFYTRYDYAHFVWNTPALLVCVVPKLPQLHGVRILGINKY